MRLSPVKVTQGATLASSRPSLSLPGAIGTATRSAGFETTIPSIELFPAKHEAKRDLPAIGVCQHKPRHRGQLACGPCQDAREIAHQIVVSLDHAPPAGAAAVAAVVDGDHVELEPGTEHLGDAAVAAAVLGKTVRDDHGPPRRLPAPPPAAEHHPVDGTDFDVANQASAPSPSARWASFFRPTSRVRRHRRSPQDTI